LQRFSCNSAEQLGQKRKAAPQSELIAALVALDIPEAIESDAVRFMLAELIIAKRRPQLQFPIP